MERPHIEFASQLTWVANELGIELEWHSANWIAQLRHGAETAYVVGFTFPLNNAASAQLARDKVATYIVLQANGIPAIPHYLLRLTTPGTPASPASASILTQVAYPLPFVIKPNEESNGLDVYRVRTNDELERAASHLSVRYQAVAISPWAVIEEEFRVVVLNGISRIIYRKAQSPPGADKEGAEWRHNLAHGATPELVREDEVCRVLTALALAAMNALGLRFASVDIVTTEKGVSVLEVNSSVTLEHFSRHSVSNSKLAREVYRDAVQSMFRI
jgi:ribosomal protein S6--L-glutamate ligase